jgi:hypothetical protein
LHQSTQVAAATAIRQLLHFVPISTLNCSDSPCSDSPCRFDAVYAAAEGEEGNLWGLWSKTSCKSLDVQILKVELQATWLWKLLRL